MENINLERFILYFKCDITVTSAIDKEDKLLVKQKVGLLLTFKSMYFYDLMEIKLDDSELEKILLFKMQLEDYFLLAYEESKAFIFTSNDNTVQVVVEIRDVNYKEILNILLLLEGYKNYCTLNNYDLSSYIDWLAFIIDNLVNCVFLAQDNYYARSSIVLNSLGIFPQNAFKQIGHFIINNGLNVNYTNSNLASQTSLNSFNLISNFITNVTNGANSFINTSTITNNPQNQSYIQSLINAQSSFKTNFSNNSHILANSLLINNDFFSIDLDALKFITHYLNRIEKYDIQFQFKDNHSYEIFKEVFYVSHKFFNNYFVNELKIEGEEEQILVRNPLWKMSYIRIIRFNSNKINDSGFLNLIDIIVNCEFIQELEVSQNEITGESLAVLSRYFSKNKKFRYLERLNFSNNWIDSSYMKEFFRNSFEQLPYLSLINLQSNYLDNDCLSSIDFYLRITKTILTDNELTIDLRDNRFDSFLFRNKYYLWKPDQDVIEKTDRKYTLFHFVDNLNKFKLKIKIKIDPIKHHKEYKHNLREMTSQISNVSLCSLNSRHIHVYSKTIHKKSEVLKDIYKRNTIPNYKNNLKTSRKTSMITNSLLKRKSKVNEIEQLYNFYDLYYISEYFFDLSMKTKKLHDIPETEMNYFPLTFNLKYQLIKHFKSDKFEPRLSIEDFYTFFNKIKSSNYELSFITLHKLINQIKIESCMNIKEKDIYSLKYITEMANFFKISFLEKINNEYGKLLIRSRTINEAILDILNFNTGEAATYKGDYAMYSELNNFLDIFLHEADTINLKNELIIIAKYIQFIRNNKSRILMYKIYEEYLRESRMITYVDSNTSDFDPIFNKYKEFKLLSFSTLSKDKSSVKEYEKIFENNNRVFELFKIPDEVLCNDLALHPNNIDYLKIACYYTVDFVITSLNITMNILKDDESYGLRNIYDRCHFLLTMSCNEKVEKNNFFHLNKHNSFLRISRVIFRYLNNLDIFCFSNNYIINYNSILNYTESAWNLLILSNQINNMNNNNQPFHSQPLSEIQTPNLMIKHLKPVEENSNEQENKSSESINIDLSKKQLSEHDVNVLNRLRTENPFSKSKNKDLSNYNTLNANNKLFSLNQSYQNTNNLLTPNYNNTLNNNNNNLTRFSPIKSSFKGKNSSFNKENEGSNNTNVLNTSHTHFNKNDYRDYNIAYNNNGISNSFILKQLSNLNSYIEYEYLITTHNPILLKFSRLKRKHLMKPDSLVQDVTVQSSFLHPFKNDYFSEKDKEKNEINIDLDIKKYTHPINNNNNNTTGMQPTIKQKIIANKIEYKKNRKKLREKNVCLNRFTSTIQHYLETRIEPYKFKLDTKNWSYIIKKLLNYLKNKVEMYENEISFNRYYCVTKNEYYIEVFLRFIKFMCRREIKSRRSNNKDNRSNLKNRNTKNNDNDKNNENNILSNMINKIYENNDESNPATFTKFSTFKIRCLVCFYFLINNFDFFCNDRNKEKQHNDNNENDGNNEANDNTKDLDQMLLLNEFYFVFIEFFNQLISTVVKEIEDMIIRVKHNISKSAIDRNQEKDLITKLENSVKFTQKIKICYLLEMIVESAHRGRIGQRAFWIPSNLEINALFENVELHIVSLSQFLNNYPKTASYLEEILVFKYIFKNENNVNSNSNNRNSFLSFRYPPEFHQVKIPIFLGSEKNLLYREYYTINQSSTVRSLFQDIESNSKMLSSLYEKKFYFLSLYYLKERTNVNIYSEEYILDLLAFLEETMIQEILIKKKEKNKERSHIIKSMTKEFISKKGNDYYNNYNESKTISNLASMSKKNDLEVKSSKIPYFNTFLKKLINKKFLENDNRDNKDDVSNDNSNNKSQSKVDYSVVSKKPTNISNDSNTVFKKETNKTLSNLKSFRSRKTSTIKLESNNNVSVNTKARGNVVSSIQDNNNNNNEDSSFDYEEYDDNGKLKGKVNTNKKEYFDGNRYKPKKYKKKTGNDINNSNDNNNDDNDNGVVQINEGFDITNVTDIRDIISKNKLIKNKIEKAKQKAIGREEQKDIPSINNNNSNNNKDVSAISFAPNNDLVSFNNNNNNNNLNDVIKPKSIQSPIIKDSKKTPIIIKDSPSSPTLNKNDKHVNFRSSVFNNKEKERVNDLKRQIKQENMINQYPHQLNTTQTLHRKNSGDLESSGNNFVNFDNRDNVFIKDHDDKRDDYYINDVNDNIRPITANYSQFHDTNDSNFFKNHTNAFYSNNNTLKNTFNTGSYNNTNSYKNNYNEYNRQMNNNNTNANNNFYNMSSNNTLPKNNKNNKKAKIGQTNLVRDNSQQKMNNVKQIENSNNRYNNNNSNIQNVSNNLSPEYRSYEEEPQCPPIEVHDYNNNRNYESRYNNYDNNYHQEDSYNSIKLKNKNHHIQDEIREVTDDFSNSINANNSNNSRVHNNYNNNDQKYYYNPNNRNNYSEYYQNNQNNQYYDRNLAHNYYNNKSNNNNYNNNYNNYDYNDAQGDEYEHNQSFRPDVYNNQQYNNNYSNNHSSNSQLQYSQYNQYNKSYNQQNPNLSPQSKYEFKSKNSSFNNQSKLEQERQSEQLSQSDAEQNQSQNQSNNQTNPTFKNNKRIISDNNINNEESQEEQDDNNNNYNSNSYSNLQHNFNNNQENNSNYSSTITDNQDPNNNDNNNNSFSSEIELLNSEDDSEVEEDLNKMHPLAIFDKIIFSVQRRLLTPFTWKIDFNLMSKIEIRMLYLQMTEKFINSEKKSVNITDEDLLKLISTIFVLKYSEDIEYMRNTRIVKEEKIIDELLRKSKFIRFKKILHYFEMNNVKRELRELENNNMFFLMNYKEYRDGDDVVANSRDLSRNVSVDYTGSRKNNNNEDYGSVSRKTSNSKIRGNSKLEKIKYTKGSVGLSKVSKISNSSNDVSNKDNGDNRDNAVNDNKDFNSNIDNISNIVRPNNFLSKNYHKDYNNYLVKYRSHSTPEVEDVYRRLVEHKEMDKSFLKFLENDQNRILKQYIKTITNNNLNKSSVKKISNSRVNEAIYPNTFSSDTESDIDSEFEIRHDHSTLGLYYDDYNNKELELHQSEDEENNYRDYVNNKNNYEETNNYNNNHNNKDNNKYKDQDKNKDKQYENNYIITNNTNNSNNSNNKHNNHNNIQNNSTNTENKNFYTKINIKNINIDNYLNTTQESISKLNNTEEKRRKSRIQFEKHHQIVMEKRINTHLKDCFPRYKLYLLQDKQFKFNLKKEILELYENQASVESLQIIFLNKIRNNEILFSSSLDLEHKSNTAGIGLPDKVTMLINYMNICLVDDSEIMMMFLFSDIVSLSYDSEEVRFSVLTYIEEDKNDKNKNSDDDDDLTDNDMINDDNDNDKSNTSKPKMNVNPRNQRYKNKKTLNTVKTNNTSSTANTKSNLLSRILNKIDNTTKYKEEVFYFKTSDTRNLIETILSYAQLHLMIYSNNKSSINVKLFEDANIPRYINESSNRNEYKKYQQDNIEIDIGKHEFIFRLFPPYLNISSIIYRRIFDNIYDHTVLYNELIEKESLKENFTSGSSNSNKFNASNMQSFNNNNNNNNLSRLTLSKNANLLKSRGRRVLGESVILNREVLQHNIEKIYSKDNNNNNNKEYFINNNRIGGDASKNESKMSSVNTSHADEKGNKALISSPYKNKTKKDSMSSGGFDKAVKSANITNTDNTNITNITNNTNFNKKLYSNDINKEFSNNTYSNYKNISGKVNSSIKYRNSLTPDIKTNEEYLLYQNNNNNNNLNKLLSPTNKSNISSPYSKNTNDNNNHNYYKNFVNYLSKKKKEDQVVKIKTERIRDIQLQQDNDFLNDRTLILNEHNESASQLDNTDINYTNDNNNDNNYNDNDDDDNPNVNENNEISNIEELSKNDISRIIKTNTTFLNENYEPTQSEILTIPKISQVSDTHINVVKKDNKNVENKYTMFEKYNLLNKNEESYNGIDYNSALSVSHHSGNIVKKNTSINNNKIDIKAKKTDIKNNMININNKTEMNNLNAVDVFITNENNDNSDDSNNITNINKNKIVISTNSKRVIEFKSPNIPKTPKSIMVSGLNKNKHKNDLSYNEVSKINDNNVSDEKLNMKSNTKIDLSEKNDKNTDKPTVYKPLASSKISFFPHNEVLLNDNNDTELNKDLIHYNHNSNKRSNTLSNSNIIDINNKHSSNNLSNTTNIVNVNNTSGTSLHGINVNNLVYKGSVSSLRNNNSNNNNNNDNNINLNLTTNSNKDDSVAEAKRQAFFNNRISKILEKEGILEDYIQLKNNEQNELKSEMDSQREIISSSNNNNNNNKKTNLLVSAVTEKEMFLNREKTERTAMLGGRINDSVGSHVKNNTVINNINNTSNSNLENNVVSFRNSTYGKNSVLFKNLTSGKSSVTSINKEKADNYDNKDNKEKIIKNKMSSSSIANNLFGFNSSSGDNSLTIKEKRSYENMHNNNNENDNDMNDSNKMVHLVVEERKEKDNNSISNNSIKNLENKNTEINKELNQDDVKNSKKSINSKPDTNNAMQKTKNKLGLALKFLPNILRKPNNDRNNENKDDN